MLYLRGLGLHHPVWWWGVLCAVSIGWTGCATAPQTSSDKDEEEGPAQPSPFPSAEELTELVEKAPVDPLNMFSEAQVDVEQWSVLGPFPAGVSVTQAPPAGEDDPWTALLQEVVASRPGLVLATEQMNCVARLLGTFQLANGGQPTQGLRDFVAGRCGSVSVRLGIRTLRGDVPSTQDAAKVFDAWRDQLREAMTEDLGAGPRTMGVWFGRQDNTALVTLVSAERRVHLEPLEPTPDANGNLVLKGQLLVDSASIQALANQGPFGYAWCAPNPQVKLPQFELSCPLNSDDPTAWIELVAFPPGRILGETALKVLAFPSKEPVDTYQRPVYSSLEAPNQGSVRAALAATLNSIRSKAGLGALVLEAEQSNTADELAPYYFSALLGQAPETVADRVVLGLKAGWDIRGSIVREGYFTSAFSVQRDSGGTAASTDLLAAAMERPMSRVALLDPEVKRLAIGMVQTQEPNATGVLLATYALFDEGNLANEQAQVLRRLTRLRTDAGRAAPRVLTPIQDEAQATARRVERGEVKPEEALNALMESAAGKLRGQGGRMAGWISQSYDLDQLPYPPDLLRLPEVDVYMAVAHIRPANEPWGRYMVFMVARIPSSI